MINKILLAAISTSMGALATTTHISYLMNISVPTTDLIMLGINLLLIGVLIYDKD